MKILVALDGTIYSKSAVDYVIASYLKKDDEIILLSVVELFKEETLVGSTLDAARARKQFYKKYHDMLTDFRIKIESHGKHTNITNWVVGGDSVEQILQWGNDLAVDLIILGTHGRRGLKRLFLGSVAQSVKKRAQCKVEIVDTILNSK